MLFSQFCSTVELDLKKEKKKLSIILEEIIEFVWIKMASVTVQGINSSGVLCFVGSLFVLSLALLFFSRV